MAQGFVDFFNRRFEFYGRKIVLKPVTPTETSAASETAMHNDALAADVEHKAFASLSFDHDANKGGQFTYYDELARRKIMSFSYLPNYTGVGHLERNAPYQWIHFPDFAQYQSHMGEWMCRALWGEPARYAGAGSNDARRVFGLIREHATASELYPDPGVIKSVLRRCGASFAVDEQSDGALTTGQTIMLKMKESDPPVTTILCMCDGSGDFPNAYMRSATSQRYFPEWIVSNYIYQDSDFVTGNVWPREQRDQAFGLDFRNKFRAGPDMPFEWALQEVGYDGANPGYDQAYWVYENILQLATAIQVAGPRLTPQAVEIGMFKTRFPNPGCGGPPAYQACVGYGSTDRSMQGDGTLMWWSSTESSAHWPQSGTYCYAHLGRRYSLGSWPSSDDGFFEPPCW